MLTIRQASVSRRSLRRRCRNYG